MQVLIAHDKEEEELAERLAKPLRRLGYEVLHQGTVLVGDSPIEKASEVLNAGGPVIVCGTKRAAGSSLVHRMVNAAKDTPGRVLVVQVESDAKVDLFSFGDVVARYWDNPDNAIAKLIESLKKHYPLNDKDSKAWQLYDPELRYRDLALRRWNVLDLPNLPYITRSLSIRPDDLQALYVPLHVMVEVSSLADEMNITKSEGLERSQKALLRGEPTTTERRPIGNRLKKGKGLVALGDTGTGKTTMLRWLANAYLLKDGPDHKKPRHTETLPGEDWLPILIRCRELNPSLVGRSLEDLLLHALESFQIGKNEVESIKDSLLQRFNSGRVILLIDGFDEISDLSARKRFREQVEAIHSIHDEIPIVVTSRSAGYWEANLRGFEHLAMAELTKEDKEAFARSWCSLVEDVERREIALKEMVKYIHSSERIERLTGNPMFLTTLALVNSNVKRLPTRRVDLYTELVLVLLNSRDGMEGSIDADEAFPQLEYVAYDMCAQNVQQLSKNDLIGLLNRMRSEYNQIQAWRKHTVEDFLHLLEHNTGILVEATQDDRRGRLISQFKFRHFTFQEHFASLALIEGIYPQRNRELSLAKTIASLVAQVIKKPDPASEPDDGSRASIIDEPEVSGNWRDVLRLCVTNCRIDDVDDVLMAILSASEDEEATLTARPRAVLAALCLTDEPNVRVETAEAVLGAFAMQVGPHDGTGGIHTRVDAVALQLVKSRWGKNLEKALARELDRRKKNEPTFSSSSVLGLCGMVGTALTQNEENGEGNWLS